MVNKHWTRQVILCSILILVLSVIAQAQDPCSLPTESLHPREYFDYHYDPQSEVVDWKIPDGWGAPGGGKFTEGGKFEDNLDAPGTDWQWETEWYNPGTDIPFSVPIVFRAPDSGDERFPIYGGVRLPLGEHVFVTLELDESAENSEYETGDYEYIISVDPNPGAPQFRHDCSFCERRGPLIGLLQQNALPPEWTPMSPEEVMAGPHVEVLVQRVDNSNAVPALSEWGVIGMALVLLTAGAIVIDWRRRRVAT